MNEPVLAPRSPLIGIGAVWAIALVTAILIVLFVPANLAIDWLLVSFGVIVLLAFAVQIFGGQTRGFLSRVAISVFGALVIMGILSAILGLQSLIPE